MQSKTTPSMINLLIYNCHEPLCNVKHGDSQAVCFYNEGKELGFFLNETTLELLLQV